MFSTNKSISVYLLKIFYEESLNEEQETSSSTSKSETFIKDNLDDDTEDNSKLTSVDSFDKMLFNVFYYLLQFK